MCHANADLQDAECARRRVVQQQRSAQWRVESEQGTRQDVTCATTAQAASHRAYTQVQHRGPARRWRRQGTPPLVAPLACVSSCASAVVTIQRLECATSAGAMRRRKGTLRRCLLLLLVAAHALPGATPLRHSALSREQAVVKRCTTGRSERRLLLAATLSTALQRICSPLYAVRTAATQP